MAGPAAAQRPAKPVPAPTVRPPAPQTGPAARRPAKPASAVVRPAPASQTARAPASAPASQKAAAPASQKAATAAAAVRPTPPPVSAAAVRPTPPRPLDMDDGARRAVRGDTEPSIVPNESEELRELRRFEEEAFPPAGETPVYPVTAFREGATPAPPGRFVGADAQPPELRTPERSRPAPPSQVEPPEWFKKLKLPDLPVRWTPKVQAYLDWFRNSSTGRSIMSRWLRRQGRYRAIIEAAAKKYHLPRDIIYVAMIESGYDPTVVSRVGATGMWQFMRRTGQVYGLEGDHWFDDRRNFERATEAAMHFWKDLYTRFGSWHLALAGYHAGYAAVLRSIVAYNTNDYWELCRHENGLPHETTLYVPKALAAAIIGNNRELFGFGDVKPDPPVTFDRVSVPASTTFATLARALGCKESDLADLNPELKRKRTPPTPWNLRVPKDTTDRFVRHLDLLHKEHERVASYVVRFGERLDDIAPRYRVSVRELRRLNGLEEGDVHAGLIMLVPRRSPEEIRQAEAEEETEETVVAVPDKSTTVEGRERVFYRVRDGDGVSDVARVFHVSLEDIARWNAIDLNVKLQSGMFLQLFVPKSFDRSGVLLADNAKLHVVTLGSEEFLDLRSKDRGRNRLVYVCRRGDTLKRIGRRFSLSVGQMARINQMPRNAALKPGQKIIVYAPERHVISKQAQARKAPRPRGREPSARVTRTGRGHPAARSPARTASPARARKASPAHARTTPKRR